VEDAEVDKAEAVPCLRMDCGLAAGGVLPLGGALGTVAAILTVEGSGGAAAERAAEAAMGRAAEASVDVFGAAAAEGVAEAAEGREAAASEGDTNCFLLSFTPLDRGDLAGVGAGAGAGAEVPSWPGMNDIMLVCCLFLGAFLEGKCRLPTLSMHARQSMVAGVAAASPLMELNLLNMGRGACARRKIVTISPWNSASDISAGTKWRLTFLVTMHWT